MDWLGWSTRALVGAVLGALLGAALLTTALAHGASSPWLVVVVGLSAGLFAAFFAEERSGLRGVLVATLSVWIAAVSQVASMRGARSIVGLVRGLGALHASLGAVGLAAYAACAIVAAALGGRSFARAATERPPGA